MLREINKFRSEKGSMMVEALAMLGLISMVTPVLYKKAAERTAELQDISAASQVRTLVKGLDDYMKDNYQELVNKVGSGDAYALSNAEKEDLLNYLPYGFMAYDSNNKSFKGYNVAVRKQVLGNGHVSLTGMVALPPAADVDKIRISKLASMVGGNGGLVTKDPATGTEDGFAQGVQGGWSANVADFGITGSDYKKEGTIVATSTYTVGSGAGGISDVPYLYRKDMGDQSLNTMSTELRMNKNAISGLNKLIAAQSNGADENVEIETAGGTDNVNLIVRGATEVVKSLTALGGDFALGGNAGARTLTMKTGSGGQLDIAANLAKMTGDVEATNNLAVGVNATIGNELSALGDKFNVKLEGENNRLYMRGNTITTGSLSALDDKFNVNTVDGVDRLKMAGSAEIDDTLKSGFSSTNSGFNTLADAFNFKTGRVRMTNVGDKYNAHVDARTAKLGLVMNDEYALNVETAGTSTGSANKIKLGRMASTSYSGERYNVNIESGPYKPISGSSDSFSVESNVSLRRTDVDGGSYGKLPLVQSYRFGDVGDMLMVGPRDASMLNNQNNLDTKYMFAVNKKWISAGFNSKNSGGGTLKVGDDTGVLLGVTRNEQMIRIRDYDAAYPGATIGSNRGYVGITGDILTWNTSGRLGFMYDQNERFVDDAYELKGFDQGQRKGSVYFSKEDFQMYDPVTGNRIFEVDSRGNTPEAKKGSVYIREGVIESDRLIARQTDTTNGTLNPADVYTLATRPNSQRPTQLYDKFQVNPAYTSVMHDIKLTTRGGARLSDILPEFVNKGIYVIDNTYKETIGSAVLDWSNGGSGVVNANDNGYTTLAEDCTGNAGTCPATPWLGFIPTPHCPPGYAKVITINPIRWKMSDVYRVAGDNFNNAFLEKVVYPKRFEANVLIDPSEGNGNHTHTGMLDLDYGVGSGGVKSNLPVTFQTNTWLNTTVEAVGTKSGTGYEPFYGWSAIMGFLYSGSDFKEYIADAGIKNSTGGPLNPNGLILWNLFPVYNEELTAVANVYCYFERRNGTWANNNLVDTGYDQLSNYRRNRDTSTSYIKRLNDPKLTDYNDPW